LLGLPDFDAGVQASFLADVLLGMCEPIELHLWLGDLDGGTGNFFIPFLSAA